MTPSNTPPLPGLDLSPPLAIAVVLGVIAVALYAVRAHRRRQHREERRRLGWFMTRCQKLLRGEIRDAELDRDAAATTEGEFWTALERLSMRWRRSDWGRLSRALENVRYAPTERGSLRDDSPWRQVLAARRLAMLRSRANRSALRAAMVRGPEITTHSGGCSTIPTGSRAGRASRHARCSPASDRAAAPSWSRHSTPGSPRSPSSAR